MNYVKHFWNHPNLIVVAIWDALLSGTIYSEKHECTIVRQVEICIVYPNLTCTKTGSRQNKLGSDSKLFSFPIFWFWATWWRIFYKRVLNTKLDIYVFSMFISKSWCWFFLDKDKSLLNQIFSYYAK